MLVDSFGRKHDYLRISLTDHCNLRCNYCMPQECGQYTSHDDLMTEDEIAYISKLFVAMGVTRIRLTGGEPLVRKDFDKILKSLSKLPVKTCDYHQRYTFGPVFYLYLNRVAYGPSILALTR